MDTNGNICKTGANRIMDKMDAGEHVSKNERKKLAAYIRNKKNKGGTLSDRESSIIGQVEGRGLDQDNRIINQNEGKSSNQDNSSESGSGAGNVPRSGDVNFIGPLTRPEHHFIFGEGIGPKQRGVLGAHNKNYFEQTLTSMGFRLDDLKIGHPVPHSTINDIYLQKYTVPAYDGRGNFIGFKNIKDPKTIYAPTVISNRQMLDWGWEVMENGVVSGRVIEGSASNGLKFRGYIDDDLITNFFQYLNRKMIECKKRIFTLLF